MKLLGQVRALLPTAKQPQEAIVLGSAGFTAPDGRGGHRTIKWSEVVEIVVYKEDLLTVDDIRLGFRIVGGEDFWTVSEDFPGFQQLQDSLPAHFPGIRTDWFGDVAFPAFAENWTVIWTKNPVG